MRPQVIYVYPFTTPVGDFGVQKARLARLRAELKWRILGCELIECYD